MNDAEVTVAEMLAMLKRVYQNAIDFNERKQLLYCRVCGSERGEYGRLHKEHCHMRDVFDLIQRAERHNLATR